MFFVLLIQAVSAKYNQLSARYLIQQYRLVVIMFCSGSIDVNSDLQPVCRDTDQTLSGYSCQYWSSNSPHQITRRPHDVSGNKCSLANPTDPTPFCYTTNPNKRWEYCSCRVSGILKNRDHDYTRSVFGPRGKCLRNYMH